jgi:hypothetical protein
MDDNIFEGVKDIKELLERYRRVYGNTALH